MNENLYATMTSSETGRRARAVFEHRITDFVRDGYIIMWKTTLDGIVWMCKMRHRSNQKRIFLKVNPPLGLLEQWTGGVLTHSETVA